MHTEHFKSVSFVLAWQRIYIGCVSIRIETQHHQTLHLVAPAASTNPVCTCFCKGTVPVFSLKSLCIELSPHYLFLGSLSNTSCRSSSHDPEAIRLFNVRPVLFQQDLIHTLGWLRLYIQPHLIKSPFTTFVLLRSASVHGHLLIISAERCLGSANQPPYGQGCSNTP